MLLIAYGVLPGMVAGLGCALTGNERQYSRGRFQLYNDQDSTAKKIAKLVFWGSLAGACCGVVGGGLGMLKAMPVAASPLIAGWFSPKTVILPSFFLLKTTGIASLVGGFVAPVVSLICE